MEQEEQNVLTLTGYENVTWYSEKALTCATVKQPISVVLEAKDEFRFYKGVSLISPICHYLFLMLIRQVQRESSISKNYFTLSRGSQTSVGSHA